MANYAFGAPDPRNTSPASPSDLGDVEGPGAIIGNGAVILGINKGGHLNVEYREVPALGLPAFDPGDPFAVGFVGLRDGTGTLASTEPGCLCEGWGVGSAGTGISGWLNIDVGSSPNVHLVSFAGIDGGTTAVSVVEIHDGSDTPIFKVTHDYHPSTKTTRLYEVVVTVENISGVLQADTRYTRAMDWDVFPTPFDEFVTHVGVPTTTQLIFSSDDGFSTPDPLLPGTFIDPASVNVDFEDLGPADHGSVFTFTLGDLAPGESKTFKTFYGNAPTEAAAKTALGAVSAELYSLGQSNTADGPTLGTPVTFIFAFGDVGGVPVEGKVAGEMLALDNTALVISGLSSSAVWLIPALAGIVGTGIYFIKSRTNLEEN